MGGVSRGCIISETVHDRMATRLIGKISLDNNGGFVQMAFNLNSDASTFDATAWTGIEIDVLGNEEKYDLRLRTDQLIYPWQSFRSEFTAPKNWATIRFLFVNLKPHRTKEQFDPGRLRRIGILAIGRVFDANIAVSAVRLYR